MFRIILLIIVLILIWYIGNLFRETVDNFGNTFISGDYLPGEQGSVSQDCYSEKIGNCLKYNNCGICLNKPNKCIFGDFEGPLFEKKCKGWLHTNYTDRHIFDEKVTRLTPSWNQHTNLASPIARSFLR